MLRNRPEFPAEQFEETFRAEIVDITFSYDERIQPECTRDLHGSNQSFLSNPDGHHAGGSITAGPDGFVFVSGSWNTTPAKESVQWIEAFDYEFGGAFSTAIKDGECREAIVERLTSAVTDPDRSIEGVPRQKIQLLTEEICVFAWPGFLAHRILPVDQHPAWVCSSDLEAEVDFGAVQVWLDGELVKMSLFVIRLSALGKSFARAYLNEAQEVFLDGHVRAFDHFGGTPGRVRYDNLKAAVVKVLKGRDRDESERFRALCDRITGSIRSSVPSRILVAEPKEPTL